MCRSGLKRHEPPERLPPHTGQLQPLQNARALEAPGAAQTAMCEARTGEALDEWLYHGGRGRSRHAVRAPLAPRVRISLGDAVEVLMTRRSPSNTKPLTVYMPLTLYTELCAEAWECERSISDYVRGLLTRRGKFARSIGTAGGYDLAAPLPPKIGTRAKRERGEI